jgi:hypothetical protein
MITLFDDHITDQLTDLEKSTLVPSLINMFQSSSTEKRVTGRRICEWFNSLGYPVSQQRLCKMISYIRQMNMTAPAVIVGTGSGYFLTSDPELVEAQIESMQGRINAMANVIDSLKAQKLSIEKSRLQPA